MTPLRMVFVFGKTLLPPMQKGMYAKHCSAIIVYPEITKKARGREAQERRGEVLGLNVRERSIHEYMNRRNPAAVISTYNGPIVEPNVAWVSQLAIDSVRDQHMIVLFGRLYPMIKAFSSRAHGETSNGLCQNYHHKAYNGTSATLKRRKDKKSEPKLSSTRQKCGRISY